MSLYWKRMDSSHDYQALRELAMSNDKCGGQHARGKRVIVIAIDASGNSERAFHYYIEHIHRHDNLVCLVHSSEHPKFLGGESMFSNLIGGEQAGNASEDTEVQKKEAELRQLEDYFIKKLEKEKIAYRSRFVWHSKPGEAIVHIAEQENAQLIITGSRGLGKIRRTIMGSVSEYVLNHSAIPVLIYPRRRDE